MKPFQLLLLFVIISCNLFAQKAPKNPTLDQKIKEFDAYVLAGQKQWEVPGLALTVVKDGQVIFKKGYGVRELGKPGVVDTETMFACASTTKAMTAVCM